MHQASRAKYTQTEPKSHIRLLVCMFWISKGYMHTINQKTKTNMVSKTGIIMFKTMLKNDYNINSEISL